MIRGQEELEPDGKLFSMVAASPEGAKKWWEGWEPDGKLFPVVATSPSSAKSGGGENEHSWQPE